MHVKLPKVLQDTLKGHPHQFSDGGKHFKIYVYGHFVAIWPKNGGNDKSPRGTLNIRSQLRRGIAMWQH